MSRWQVICIDDEKEILDIHREYLKTSGHEIIIFENPEKALKHIQAHHKKIIMIFSDFKMPEVNGFELRQKILDNAIDIPYAVITGFFDKKMAVEAMALRICQFVAKPVSEEILIEILQKESAPRILQLLEEEQMVKEFLQETSPMLEEIEDLILALEENPNSEQTLNTYFRLLHTIKGTSSCLGLLDISSYAHHYEDLIGKIKDHKQSLNQKVANTLLAGLDQLKRMYALAQEGKVEDRSLEELFKIFEQDFNSEIEVIVEGQDGKTIVAQEEKQQKKAEDKISVSVELLSQFLEMSGELTVIRNTIFKNLFKLHQKYFGDRDIELLTDSMSEMQKVSSQLQQHIGDMKKVNIEQIMRPMKRVLRDSAKATHKEVEMEIVGENLRIDSGLGKLFSNILVHMIRNAVDHGVEDKVSRKNAGKSEVGNLKIEFKEFGEFIHVEINDDGKGIDPEVIRKKALEKGLYTKEQLAAMSEQKVFAIIFESGFSTAQTVSSISGRGVGMDMVKSSLEEFGGKFYIDSKLGQGTKFLMVIPIPRSILIIKSLMVQSNGIRYCVPLDEVAEVVLFEKNDSEDILHEIEGKQILSHHGELVPILYLSELLNGKTVKKDDDLSIVIVKDEGFKFGLVVDLIEDIEEVVVKPMSKMIKQVDTYLGATFIGEGELAMILNVKGIAKKYNIETSDESEYDMERNQAVDTSLESEFLHFSLNERANFVIPLQDVFRLEEVHGNEIEFSGNKALIKYRGKAMPLCFMEQLIDESGQTDPKNLRSLVDVNATYSVIVANRSDRSIGLIVTDILEISKTAQVISSENYNNPYFLGTIYINDHLMNIVNLTTIMNLVIKRKMLEVEVEQAEIKQAA